MKFTKELVNEYADKLLIGLTEEENKMVLDEFEMIDKSINLINNIEDIDKVIPMSYCLDDFVCEITCEEYYNENRYVYCGEIIPEGRQICKKCEEEYKSLLR